MRIALAVGLLCMPTLLAPSTTRAQQPIHVVYQAYAAGFHVADIEARVGIGPWTYQVDLTYHSTGLVGALFHWHQDGKVHGAWGEHRAIPAEYTGIGVWGGEPRIARITYEDGQPTIRQIVPPVEENREPVPPALQANSIDLLSVLAGLVKTVMKTGRCEGSATTYDGRRASAFEVHTIGPDQLPPSNRSPYQGAALRCDFTSRMVGGFLRDDHGQPDIRPMNGSAWMAQVVPGAPPMPLRLSFVTRWFGDATAYLVTADTAPIVKTAAASTPGG